MAHYNSYESFKTKKSIDKKKRAKKKTLGKKNNKLDDFVIKSSDKYGIVIEVRYNDVYVLYDELHPEAAYEIITGRKIDVLSSTEGNLPTMFIERKNEDTEKFDILWPNELEDYLKIEKDTLNKQLDYWEYEGKKGIYNRTPSHSYQKKKM